MGQQSGGPFPTLPPGRAAGTEQNRTEGRKKGAGALRGAQRLKDWLPGAEGRARQSGLRAFERPGAQRMRGVPFPAQWGNALLVQMGLTFSGTSSVRKGERQLWVLAEGAWASQGPQCLALSSFSAHASLRPPAPPRAALPRPGPAAPRRDPVPRHSRAPAAAAAAASSSSAASSAGLGRPMPTGGGSSRCAADGPRLARVAGCSGLRTRRQRPAPDVGMRGPRSRPIYTGRPPPRPQRPENCKRSKGQRPGPVCFPRRPPL